MCTCLFVTVLIRQGCKASEVASATVWQKVLLCFLYGRTCGCSACYRSRRVKARRPFGWQGERHPSMRGKGCPRLQSPGAGHCCAYSGGGRRLCSFRSSRPFQYLKLLSKCCIRLGRSAKAREMTKEVEAKCWIRPDLFFMIVWFINLFIFYQHHYLLIHFCIPRLGHSICHLKLSSSISKN